MSAIAPRLSHAEITRIAEALRSRQGRAKRLTTGGDWGSEVGGFIDEFRVTRAPSGAALVREYEAVAYACANANARAVSAVPYRLMVKTEAGQRKPRCPTRPVSRKTMQRLCRLEHLSGWLSKAVVVEEVESHPLLDQLAGEGSNLTQFHLWWLTQLYLETVGKAPWLILKAGKGPLAGAPSGIFVLPAHQVQVDGGKSLEEPIAWFKWQKQKFRVEDVVYHRFPSLQSPYTDGTSPLRAAWQGVSLMDKHFSHMHASLNNRARPDILISPAGPPIAGEFAQMGFGSEAVDRLQNRWNRQLRRGGGGSVLAIADPIKMDIPTFPPRDLELVAFHGLSKEDVANAFGVPVALLSKETNLANLGASLRLHAENAIEPRLKLLDGFINDELVPMYDPDRRLALVHDNPVPEDEKIRVLVRKHQLADGVKTINELRAEDGEDPVPWGDEPWLPIGKAQPGSMQRAPKPQEPPQKPPEGGGEGREPQKPQEPEKAATGAARAAYGAGTRPRGKQEGHLRELPAGERLKNVVIAIMRRQRREVLSRVLSRLSATAAGSASGAGSARAKDLAANLNADIDLAAWDAELGENAGPVMMVYAEEGSRDVMARLGATDEAAAWQVQLPEIEDAIREHSFHFAASTNATTSHELNTAITMLKNELTAGILDEGETIAELTKRVGAIFDRAERSRARRIAETEASRAVHTGQYLAAKQSGMVAGFRWLASSDACELCLAMVAEHPEGVAMGQAFADDGTDSPYAITMYPPLHPHCRCTVTEVLRPLEEVLYGEGWAREAEEE